jgi:competence protein ComEA
MRQYLNNLVGILIGLILAGALWLIASQPRGAPVTLQPPPTPEPIVVSVVGEVPRPGVYELPQGSRVGDALQAAGGFLSDADKAQVNLAARLEDGQQIEIPLLPSLADASAQGLPAGLININTADAEELDTLPGVGPTTAQKIIDYRTQNGDFENVEDLLLVPGIGSTTFEELKDLITVND